MPAPKTTETIKQLRAASEALQRAYRAGNADGVFSYSDDAALRSMRFKLAGLLETIRAAYGPAVEDSKHTPGPWTAWDDDGTGTLPCVLAQQTTSYGTFYVAQCNVFADARLIASAPELLAALEETVDQLEEAYDDGQGARPTAVSAVVHRARAALAKAEGR